MGCLISGLGEKASSFSPLVMTCVLSCIILFFGDVVFLKGFPLYSLETLLKVSIINRYWMLFLHLLTFSSNFSSLAFLSLNVHMIDRNDSFLILKFCVFFFSLVCRARGPSNLFIFSKNQPWFC